MGTMEINEFNQENTDNMLSDAPVSGMESVKMKKLRIEKVCSIVLGEDYNKDFIYEDVDFTKPSAIKEAYEVFEEYTSDKEVNKMIKDIAKKAKVTIKLRDNVVSLKSNGDLDTFLVAVKNFNKTSDVPMIAHQIWRAGEGRIKVPAVNLTYNQKIPASMFATYEGNKEFNEAKRMKYDKVIKKLKDGEWDTSMDVKQRMHLTYTDNNTGKKKVVFVESLQEADLEEAAAKVIRIPNGASMQVARHNKRAGYWEPANNKTMRVTSGGNYEVVDVEDRYNSGRFYIFLANNKHYMINASAISVVEDTQYEESADLEEANGDWVIYNKKTGKRLSPSKSWRKWIEAKAAASKIGGDAEVADAAWYQDNKDKLMGEATDLEEAKNATVRELRQMLFKIDSSAADKFRRELFNIDKQDSPATSAQIKKAKTIIGNRFGKDAFVQLEAKGDKQQDIESLEKMIKNPDPKRFNQYGGKEGYLKMLNSKLAKLKA